METIEKLESSIGKLLDSYRKLREENEGLSRNARIANEELVKARDIISGLRADAEHIGQPDERFRDLEAKKLALRKEVHSIIEKIDRCMDSNDIDMFTNA